MLTAAHCFLDIDGWKEVAPTNGTHKPKHCVMSPDNEACQEELDRGAWALIGTPDLQSGGERIQILNVTTHPDFRHGIPADQEHDVAIVELSRAVLHRLPICMVYI